ncbi:MAG: hypothetical protein JNM43_15175 [Planctomycetaceae bacterium]|nr:hypothetical protein [Planctomycetaceae bacterium]
MDRLKLFLALFATACLATSSYAQTAGPGTSDHAAGSKAAQASSGSFSVIGDVEHPNSYACQQALSIFEAVRKANPLSAEVNVTVVRSAQTRSQWTLLLNMNSTDSGEQLVAGDVLIVHSLSPVTVPQKNAAVQTPSGTQIVALADDQVVIGDVLTGLGLATSTHTLSVPARMPGQSPSRNTALSDRVQHGDVICLGSIGTQQTRDFGSVRHSFSEWKSSEVIPAVVPAATAPVLPVPSAAVSLPEDVFSVVPASTQDLTIPVPAASVDSGATEATNATLTIPVESDPFDVQSAPVALADPFASEDEVNSSLEVKPVSQQAASGASTPASSDVAPMPPVEDLIQPESAVNAEMNLLNILVIGGLLVAGILVLVGSLRVEDDLPVAATQQSVMDYTNIDVPQMSEPVVEAPLRSASIAMADELEVRAERLLASKMSENIIPAAMIPEVPAQAVAGIDLVKEGEWFSRDWAPRALAAKDGIAETTAPASPAFLLEKTVDEAIQAKIIEQPVMPSPKMVSQPVAPIAVPIAEPIAAKPVENMKEEILSDDLDDLIQNRLPIDLKEVQLPLRINLFGRPAGPRRLRIDAAHTAIRAPHMVSSADRRRNDSVSSRIAVGASETAEEDLQFGTQNPRKERIDS